LDQTAPLNPLRAPPTTPRHTRRLTNSALSYSPLRVLRDLRVLAYFSPLTNSPTLSIPFSIASSEHDNEIRICLSPHPPKSFPGIAATCAPARNAATKSPPSEISRPPLLLFPKCADTSGYR